MNSHELHIHNCVLRDARSESMKIVLNQTRYNVELDLMNITTHNGGTTYSEGDISINIQQVANYVVTIRDSYIGNSRGAAITVASLHTEVYHSQLLHISNSTIDKCAAGIDIDYFNSPAVQNTQTLPQIIIENCIVMNISGTGDEADGPGLSIIGVAAEQPQFSVVLSNVSFENNKSPLYLYNTKEVELVDCKFVGNQGTPITVRESTLKIAGTLSFVNNTAYQGGAIAFYGKSYVSVSFEKNTEILFKNNYAEHVGGAIFAEEIA